jgi:hypothetical protein
MVAKVRERMGVSKQVAQNFDGKRLNHRKLNKLEFRKKSKIEIIDKFAALENLSDGEGLNRAWENIKENIKTSATECQGLHELQQHKLWFHEECLGFLDQRN